MIRMATMVTLAMALLGCGGSGSDGGGDDSSGGGASGLDGSLQMNDLDDAQLTQFCTWYVDALGGEGTTTQCGEDQMVVGSVDDCKTLNCDTCEATVHQNETCTEAMAADPCNGGQNQSCGPILGCMLNCAFGG
jgi:hypothetical protein